MSAKKLFSWTDVERILSAVNQDVPKNTAEVLAFIRCIALFNSGVSYITLSLATKMVGDQLDRYIQSLQLAIEYLGVSYGSLPGELVPTIVFEPPVTEAV